MNTLEFILKRYGVENNQQIIPTGRSRNYELPRLYRDLGFTVGAEIGVAEGWFSGMLCKGNPKLKLYAVDPWENYPEYGDFRDIDLPDIYNKARETLKPYNVHFIKDYSMDAVKRFADESLDFVFIDANHDYEHCTEDLREWSKKVRKGGIVSGHDYKRYKHQIDQKYIKVKQAVNDWITTNNIKPLFVLDKRAGSTYFYVKT